ncbi:hypothetical protein [Enterococcus sp. AZ109]|uniref:hypothetical protein n=1 Tax=Enterococcus sp. AZ109 TaxID=2774634 RepID=UPI003F1F019C
MGVKLTQRQLFSMKRKGLEKRLSDYYAETMDAGYIIQSAVAIQVRNALTTEDFSFIAKDLIRDLFLTSDNLRSVRHLCFFFRVYFTNDEWTTVIKRLFETPEKYLEEAQMYVKGVENLQPWLSSGSREEEEDISIYAVFKDGLGNKHKWRLSAAEKKLTSKECYDIMYILGFLNILKKDGVRHFVKPIRSDFVVTHHVENPWTSNSKM